MRRVQAKLAAWPRSANRVLSMALNRSIRYTRTRLAKEAVEDATIGTTRYKRYLRIVPSKPYRLAATMYVSLKRIPLGHFKVKRFRGRSSGTAEAGRIRGGVVAETRRGSQKLIPNAFIQTLKTGHKGVFKIHSQPGPRGGHWRELFGPSAGQVFRRGRGVYQDTMSSANRFLFGEVNRLTELFVKKKMA